MYALLVWQSLEVGGELYKCTYIRSKQEEQRVGSFNALRRSVGGAAASRKYIAKGGVCCLCGAALLTGSVQRVAYAAPLFLTVRRKGMSTRLIPDRKS